MNWISSMTGTVTVSITGPDIPGTLDQLARMGVDILRCRLVDELEASLILRRSDYRRVRALCRKRGDDLRLQDRGGAYWALRRLLQRPVLMAGLLFYLLTALFLPTRVLFVRVSGNEGLPSGRILEAASDCGIRFGASRREVRSEKMKNALLEALPQLQWAGVNTFGCVAEISVRERSMEDLPEEEGGFGHVIAVVDGYVLSATATRGSLLCGPGQAVAAGDILISGYTDCGLTIRAERAEGEIFAATRRNLAVITSDSVLRGIPAGEEMQKISLLIGKKRINLWKDSGFSDITCDRMYEENYITLPGGFQLPFGWCVERYRFRTLIQTKAEPETLRELLATAGESYLRQQMVAGTIRKSDLSFAESEGYIQMTGEYGCEEMIGFRQRLEIGDTNGKND